MRMRYWTIALVLCAAVLVPEQALAKPHKTIHKKGKLTALHLDRGSAQLETKAGELVTFYVTSATRYVKNKKPMAATDLKRGMPVSAHCVLENGKFTASKVVIAPDKPDKS